MHLFLILSSLPMTVCPFPAFCYVSLLSHESPLSLLLLCFCHIFFTSLMRPLLHTVDLRYLNSSTSTTCTPCSCHTVVFSFTHMYSALLLMTFIPLLSKAYLNTPGCLLSVHSLQTLPSDLICQPLQRIRADC